MENPYQDKTPGQLAELLLILAAEFENLSVELEDILKWKDLNWTQLRQTVQSDKQADRLWFQTEPGLRERSIEMRTKNIKVQQSSIKHYLKVKENEARSLY